ncbi:MAG TPA: cell division protein ZapA [Saliniramus sp.]|nr:cell division protein ZapA [Saliniramus sp.]
MAQVTVTIAGKSYRMACADGEEGHLEALGALYDGKITQMRDAFGEIGDMRLHVMAALMVADELTEAKGAINGLQSEIADLKTLVDSSDDKVNASEEQFARAILAAAERVERIARSLNTSGATGNETREH